MALSILDGNQSATTLSTILSSGQHITAHTVVSLGTQAITDMRGAVSGSVVSISNLPSTQTIAGTVTVGVLPDLTTSTDFEQAGTQIAAGITNYGSIPIAGTVTANPTGTQTIAGTVTAMAGTNFANEIYNGIFNFSENEQMGVYVTSALPTGSNNIGRVTVDAGTNRIGVVTIGAGTVTIGAGTAQIGSVTASLAYSQTATTISSTAVTAIPVVFPTSGALGGSLQGYNGSNTYIYSGIQAIGSTSLASATSLPVSLTTLPALAAGIAQIGSVTASISNSVTIASFATSVTARLINPAGTAVTYAEVGTAGNPSIDVLSVQGVTSGTPLTILNHQGTTVTTSNFTSTTASTVLASANTSREVLTIFNEGAGNLHICAGATCTTIAYQVRLSAGDYYEVPLNQTSLTHSAVFATAGTARVVQIS